MRRLARSTSTLRRANSDFTNSQYSPSMRAAAVRGRVDRRCDVSLRRMDLLVMYNYDLHDGLQSALSI